MSKGSGRRTVKKRRSLERRGTVRMLESVRRISQLLKSGAVVTTKQLQEELEASRSTVLRYLTFLRDRFHIDVWHDYVAGGYRIRGDAISLPEPTLTEGDLIALYVATPILKQYRGTKLGEQFESSFEKLISFLPDRMKSRIFVPLVEAKARVPSNKDAKTFSNILSALNHSRQLEINYASAHRGVVDDRVVDPYVLCVVNARWYLLAHDHRRNRVLPFAVDRIWVATEKKPEFRRPVGFSAQEHLRDAFGIYQPPKESGEVAEEITIRFDKLAARYVRETEWHSTQTIKKLESGEIELTIKVRGTLEVEGWVLSWGEHAEVLRPASLRKRLKERLSRALAKYDP